MRTRVCACALLDVWVWRGEDEGQDGGEGPCGGPNGRTLGISCGRQACVRGRLRQGARGLPVLRLAQNSFTVLPKEPQVRVTSFVISPESRPQPGHPEPLVAPPQAPERATHHGEQRLRGMKTHAFWIQSPDKRADRSLE